MPEKNVLIVDDEGDVREVFAGILKGDTVDLAGTVAAAKRLLAAHQYAMVLVDWRLPDGDGAVIANLAGGRFSRFGHERLPEADAPR
jgi:DNA-binding NtrC family response regulator